MKKDVILKNRTAIAEKIKESARSVLPIVIIVTLLCFSIAPINTDLMLNFFIGTVMVVVGIGLFSLGADTSMIKIGNKIGTALTKTKKLPLIVLVSFAFGFAVTIAEPDLQVLAETVPHINNTALLITVGVGVGFFLAVCMVRILTGIKLRWLLIAFYALVFILSAFTDDRFLSIAFDSGGVTTGPMTVPFILALGVGVSNIRSDDKAEADSFGLVALSSIGPILAVLILGFFYPGASIHPAYPKTSEKWLSLFREKGLVWVGELVHYRAGRGDYDNAEWIRLFELCCVQLHFSPSVIRLAKRLPSLRIVNSHIDVPHLRALAECPNVLLDVSGFAGGLRFNAMESARIAFGPDRILFGTDFTVYEPEAFLLRSRHAFPDPEEQKKLYSGNLLSLLKSAGAGRVFYSGEQTCMQ